MSTTHFSGPLALGPGSVETLAADKALTADDNGMTFFIGRLGGGLSFQLPAPVAGMRFDFIVRLAPSTDYVITTDEGEEIMIGGINELEVDTDDDGPYSSGAHTLTFVASVAVVGDRVSMISDGTNWYLTGQTNADGGITLSSSF
jgi:hypothetical protein